MELLQEYWLYAVMVFLALVMLWAQGQSKKFKSSWARPLVVACTLFILALAATQVFKALTRDQREGDRIRENEYAYLAAAMQTLGDEFGSNHPGAKILVINSEPTEFNKLQVQQDVIINSLQLGLNGRGKLGSIVHPKYSDDITDPVEEGMITAAMLDQLIEENPQHQIVLNLVGMPHDYQDMALWTMEEETRPKLALYRDSVFELQRAIAGGYICAAVIYKPGFRFVIDGPPAPENYSDAFAERFLLVTSNNVDDLAAEHPNMFFVQEEDE
jgi:hypothetical protein